MHIGQRLKDWINLRFPAQQTYEKHLSKYYAPKNLNFWYLFGMLSMLVLLSQLITGISLAMMYTPSIEGAFASIEGNIMRDITDGWLLRYMHAVGASALFLVIYLHMFRGLLYGSYKKPRELIWLVGMGLYVLIMAEGFFGYVLPWGNMSFWGAQVIFNLPAAIPSVGDSISTWLRGDFILSGITLNRVFALHVIAIPLILFGFIFVHLVSLHHVGSNNPDGIEIKKQIDKNGVPLDGIPLHPYYTSHNLVSIVIFLILFFAMVFFWPEGGGHILEPANFEPANLLKTPDHIAPVWYFTPFYAILMAIPNKLGGVLALMSSVSIFFFLPWLDRSPVKSMRYKGKLSKIWLTIFVISIFVLSLIGATPQDHALLPFLTNQTFAQIMTCFYFLYFLLMPLYTGFENYTVPPDRLPRGRR
jgi:ubiquinol-cytochrome c reductase cytochrome b subunit